MAKNKRKAQEEKTPKGKSSKKGKPSSSGDGDVLTVIGRMDTNAPRDDEFLGEFIKISDYLYERKVPTPTLKENVSKFLRRIGDIVADAPQAFGAYELHEIEFSAEITVSGDLKLIGMEGKAGVKFIIRRQSTQGSSNENKLSPASNA